ncbi:aminoglycoside phosphotransferase family protein [Streptomyces sp. NPDC005562]|uniref:phosphotransferase family protein n=1 Tax=Streptomyces sp. NPDC005562 TaxID=3154890 RepID=UPI0033ADDAD3
MSSPLRLRARAELVRRLGASLRSNAGGRLITGHHNTNHIVPLTWPLALLLGKPPFGAHAKFRTPIPAPEVCPRAWPREADVLAVVSRHLSEVPRCLADFGTETMHEYRSGECLADLAQYGQPVPEEVMVDLAAFFARAAGVPGSELPPLPADWPASGDSTGFLRRLAAWTERHVRLPHEERFGPLFDAFGIPQDAMTAFGWRRPPLTPRPFCLLHTDVHRANVIVEGAGICVIDWELALYGDPLHDLATHLVRMEYDADERERMVKLWADAMSAAGLDVLTEGLASDLPVYVDFEHAQSVYPDLMRAALTLPPAPKDFDFAAAAWRMCRSVRRAAEPLGLPAVPDEEAATEALIRWYGSAGRATR